MALGIAKHKVHELWAQVEERVVRDLAKGEDIAAAFESELVPLAQRCVRVNKRALDKTGVPLTEAFTQVLAVARSAADESVSRIAPFVTGDLEGDDLWDALSPKRKCEYSIESKALGVKGRIDALEIYPDRIVPVELKSGSTPSDGVYDHHRMQVACYALALEEIFGTSVSEAVVHYVDGNARRSVVMNPFVREHVVEVAAKAHECLRSRELPKGCARDSCDACARCEDGVFVAEMLNRKL